MRKKRGPPIKTLRRDRGGEFISNEFSAFCESNGITRYLTAPYTPQQNGVVERRNRTLLDMVRSIQKHMKFPNYLWGEAVSYATYIINRAATRVIKNKTPYELFKGKKPSIEHLQIFGCIGYAKVDSQHLKKLDNRSRMLVHLGTEPGSKAYRLFDPTSKRMVVRRDVIFDESKCWDWNKSNKEESGTLRIDISQFGNHGINDGNFDTNQKEDVAEDHEESNEENVAEGHDIGTLNQEEDENSTNDQFEPDLRRSQRERK